MQDGSGISNGPDVVGRYDPRGIEVVVGAAGLGGPGRPVPLQDPVKEQFSVDGNRLNSSHR